MKLAVCLAILVVLCLGNVVSCVEFDFFYFVREWSGSFCQNRACPLVNKKGFHLTIHGLWPTYDNGSWPQFCDPSNKFDQDALKKLDSLMEHNWPTYLDSNSDFWSHEWERHGTCAQDVLGDEFQYFSKIIKLHKKYDLENALRKADIRPRPDVLYSVDGIVKAVQKEYGVRPIVHCSNGNLTEIWMCFNKTLDPYNCRPDRQESSCKWVEIPPFKVNGASPFGQALKLGEFSGTVHQFLERLREFREEHSDCALVRHASCVVGAAVLLSVCVLLAYIAKKKKLCSREGEEEMKAPLTSVA